MSEIPAREIWEDVKVTLKTQISKANYTTWLADTQGDRWDGNQLVVLAPNVFVQEWLEKRLSSLVTEALIRAMKALPGQTFTREDVQIQFEVNACDTANVVTAKPGELFAVKPTFNPRYTFETFVAGPENKLALSAAVAVAENPGEVNRNPLLFLSRPGMGKTHLLNAIAYEVSAKKHLPVLLVTAERFTIEFVAAIRDHGVEGFRTRFCNPAILLVDDINFLGDGKKEKTVETFCNCLNELHEKGRQIVLAGNSMPELPERLTSRLLGGLVVEIKPSGPETRLAILQAKASQQYADLDPRILALIAEKTADGDIRILLGKWNSLLAHFHLLGKEPSFEAAKEISNDGLFPSAPGSAESALTRIIEAVILHFGVTLADLKSGKRSKKITQARQTAMHLLRERGCSLEQIGRMLGDRHHSTVLHGCRIISEDPSLRETSKAIQRSCK